MSHTPGPWAVATEYGSAGGIKHKDGFTAFTAIPRNVFESQNVGESWLDMRTRTQPDRDSIAEEQKANARLIAAAPELLAALQAVIRVADRKTDEFDMAHAAIAKATGVAQ